jgi:WD40 repeat protein/predicted Ser/Thr protein kinase
MQLCINSSCPKPADPLNVNNPICRHCGSELLLQNRYKVTRLLSDNSGFSKVYEVDDRGKLKILKVLKEDYNTNLKALDLFHQEAAVLTLLDHPGIPKVDGYFPLQLRNRQLLHCIVMEKIDGPNLEEWQIKRGNRRVLQEQALNWLKQLTEILDIVHQHSYFHRDIKPSNIMMRSTEHLVLIDFGSSREMTYTYFGKVGGQGKVTKVSSAGYTPPEQENGHAVPQSDFYALGRTMVYLLTGKDPTDPAIYDAYNDELHWRNHARGISPQLADLIDELMAPKAGQRPKNTQELLQRLEKITFELYPPPSLTNLALKGHYRVPLLLGGALILIMALGGYGVYWQFHPSKAISSTAKTISDGDISLVETLTGHSAEVLSIAISPDGQTLASASKDNTIKIWNLSTGQVIRTLTGHSNWVSSVAFSPDGRTLASGSWDETIKIWDLRTGELIRTLTGHSSWVYSVAFNPQSDFPNNQDGYILASGSYDKTIKVWNLSTGEEIRTLTGHSGWVGSVAFSPDGRTLASGSLDDTIKIWDVATGQLIHTLKGHSSSVQCLAFSPDGSTLASGSKDSTIKVWNMATGEEIHTLTGHSDSVVSLAYSPTRFRGMSVAYGPIPDGQTLVSGSLDNTIKIWNVATGQLLHTLKGDANSVFSVAVSPDGQTLASGNEDNTINIWRAK